MIKNCRQCNQVFEITDSDLEFYEKVSPVFGGKKELIPPPTLCPECRQQRRIAHGNQINLYERKCDATGVDMISNFDPTMPYKVYVQDYWWSDKWDPLSYGRDFDFSRPFFDQMDELWHDVPFPAVQTAFQFDENSRYTNHAGLNKNCYLIFDSDENRDCYYSYSLNKCENVIESYRARDSELCYGLVDCVKCYNSKFLQDCTNCIDSWFLKNCTGCRNCIMSVNLYQKEFYVGNEFVGKEKYLEIVAKLKSRKVQEQCFSRLQEMSKTVAVKYLHGLQNENVLGDYLTNSKNADHCFDSMKLWDCKYVYQAFSDLKTCMDIQQCGLNTELLYESAFCGYNAYHLLFSIRNLGQCNDHIYTQFSPHSSNLFGCMGLRRKQYCILNKQYTKDEYEILVPKIIEHMRGTGEWGEFFPLRMSPYGYNLTPAQMHMPLTREEALAKGFKWSDYISPAPKVAKIVKASQLPDTISEVPDEILNWAIECEVTQRPFSIIKQELQFLREHGLPLPKRHPIQRIQDRFSLRNKRKLYHRGCATCAKPIETTYAPDRTERVLCEECYLKEVY